MKHWRNIWEVGRVIVKRKKKTLDAINKIYILFQFGNLMLIIYKARVYDRGVVRHGLKVRKF